MLLIVHVLQLWKIKRLPNAGKVYVHNNIRYVQLSGITAPFSFLRTIFFDPNAHEHTELQHILQHEEAHVQQYHSADMLLSSFYCCLCWINPFAWRCKRALQLNLEYLAEDNGVRYGIVTPATSDKDFEEMKSKESNDDIKGLTTDSTYAERFPSGKNAYSRELSKTIRYPRVCQENGIGGNVTVQYKIQPDGTISDVEVLSAPHQALGEEVKRAVGALPAFRADPSGKTVTVTLRATYFLETPNGKYIPGPPSAEANRDLVIVGYQK